MWQTRTKNPNRKYSTVSCSEFPGAVNHKVSRCHFPLANSPLKEGTRLILTEGALKADVAQALSGDQNVAFAAILGVSTTVDLLEKIPMIRSSGIRTVYNGFDMDRLTNPNVRKATDKLFFSLCELDMGVEHLYWGEECARRKLLYFRAVARNYGIDYTAPEGASVYECLRIVGGAVLSYEIDPKAHDNLNPFSYEFGSKEDKTHFYWDSETKGIDDYLFSQQRSG